ncbi:hypothetical protein GCM10027084_26490 [Pseudoxanthomonas sangjuensis]|uniref:HEAT repeat domain-containing protein n=1 Tax=Pseudoxanthomonas sangjuensis TaxID=1503750 RepID=UPI001391A3B0|nr:HEAT repeat domain-containing protein [Pseudoxanthomonas sangjuensis]KAF1714477.1 hypothetical protein CSC71_03635 [Pseudoxanthomonas sangjuensis]
MRIACFARLSACAILLALLTACAPSSYAVRNPAPSGLIFDGTAQATTTTLNVVDSRTGNDRVFSSGVLPAALTVDGAPVEAYAYLTRNLQAELASRGVDTEVKNATGVLPQLDLKSFRMQNHRTNAYSPFVTFTFLSGDLVTDEGAHRLGVFVKRGKVPVWSFNEVIEPTLNEPLSLAIKELAAKIAGRLYGARSSDAEVDRLAAKLSTRGDNSYLDVYALGFTNNPKAIATVQALTKDPDEYVRIAAISSLGTLGASDQLPLLESIYRDGNMWQDRAMALKAIGDLDTAEARAFLSEQLAGLKAAPASNETNWTLQVIGLYQ